MSSSTPLPPQLIAKIASSFGANSAASPSPLNVYLPSQRPQVNHAHSYSRHHHRATTATRLLIHVIPPEGLVEGNQLLGPGSSTDSNYRRGVLLPLHTTLQGQLGAIKREYNFPSTVGLILILLQADDNDNSESFVGPQLTEESWKSLWGPAIRIDREELQKSFAPRLATSPSSAASADEAGGQSDADGMLSASPGSFEPSSAPSDGDRTLRPLLINNSLLKSPSMTTLGSLASFNSVDSIPPLPARAQSSASHRTASGPPLTPLQLQNHLHFHDPARSDSQSLASETLSITSSHRRMILARSPIVGKVEFDIDLTKGSWYDKWSARKRAMPTRILLSQRTAANRSSSQPSVSSPPPPLPRPVYSDQGVETDVMLHQSRRRAHANADESFTSPGGYAPLEDDGEGESDSDYEQGDGDVDPENDEEDWKALRAQVGKASRRRMRRKDEFDVDLEGEISEADPIGGGHGGKSDVEEVLDIWRGSQISQSAGLSSPITLKVSADDGSSSSSKRGDIRSAKPTRPLPPPLHLHPASDSMGGGPTVQVVQASPFASPSASPIPLSPAEGSSPVTPGHPRSSDSLDVIRGRKSSISSSSSMGDDGDEHDIRRQLKMRKRLDSLEKHIVEASPKVLSEEPSLPDDAPTRTTPRDILERITQHNGSRSVGGAGAGAPTFFVNGFARPTPGQPLIHFPASPAAPRSPAPSISGPNWSASPFDHVANELRMNREKPPHLPMPLTPRSPPSSESSRSQVTSIVSDDSSRDAPRTSMTTPTPSGMVTPAESSSARTSIAGSVVLASSSAISQRPATPAVLDPPPRTFSLPQPSSRFSDDSFMSEAQGSDEAAGVGSASSSIKNGTTGPNASSGTPSTPGEQRFSVKNITKLLVRTRSKSRDGRVSREIPPPVPIPSPQINAPRAPPMPPPPLPANTPLRTGGRSPSPVTGKSGPGRPSHTREDSGSDPFHFDQIASSGAGRLSTPPLQSPSTPVAPTSSAGTDGTTKKRGILKGWGSSSARPTAAPPLNGNGVPQQQQGLPQTRVVSPPNAAEPSDLAQRLATQPIHSRNDSSLSARGLKMTHRESWISIAETNSNGASDAVAGSPASTSSSSSQPSPNPASASSQTQKSQPQSDLMSIDEREATQYAAVAAQKRRETMSSLRPPISPSSTESSGGPRASVDEILTPRSSQFEMVTPSPTVLTYNQNQLQPQRSSYAPDRI